MQTSNVATTASIARLLGVSRQALTQAMARSFEPPQPVMNIGDSKGYDIDEVTRWWADRLDGRAQEWKERRINVAKSPTAQLNIRISSIDSQALGRLRSENETIAAVARRILREALGTTDQ